MGLKQIWATHDWQQAVITVYMLAHVVGDELAAGDDATAVDWFPLNGPLPEMAFAPDITIIKQFIAGALARFPIDPSSMKQVYPS